MPRDRLSSHRRRGVSSKRGGSESSVIIGNNSWNGLENFHYARALFSAPVIFWSPGGRGRGSPCRPGLFLKSLCLSAQVLSWWRNLPRSSRFGFLPPPPRPQQHRARAECEPVFSGSTVPGPTRGTGREWATGMHPEQSQIVQAAEERKNGWGWGWGGGCWLEEEEKLFLSVPFLRRYWRITQLFGGGHTRGAKKEKKNPERAEVYRHSGPYRKVTFERTIARLFGHICCMNEA